MIQDGEVIWKSTVAQLHSCTWFHRLVIRIDLDRPGYLGPISWGFQAGGSFGELALLYFAPRAAAHLESMWVCWPFLLPNLPINIHKPFQDFSIFHDFPNISNIVCRKKWWSWAEAEASWSQLPRCTGVTASRPRSRPLRMPLSLWQLVSSSRSQRELSLPSLPSLQLSSPVFVTFCYAIWTILDSSMSDLSDLSFTFVIRLCSSKLCPVEIQELLMKAAHLTVQATMQTMQYIATWS